MLEKIISQVRKRTFKKKNIFKNIIIFFFMQEFE